MRPGPTAFTLGGFPGSFPGRAESDRVLPRSRSEVFRGKSRAIAVREANATHPGLGRSPRQTRPRKCARTSRRGQCLARARTSAPDPRGFGAHCAVEKRAQTIRRFHCHEARIPRKGSGLRSCGDARTEAAKCAHIFLVLFAEGNGRALGVRCSLRAPRSLGSSRGKPPSVNAAGPRCSLL